MTSFGAYINEGSLANPIVFDEIKSRCSGAGARILCDTNPDHPEHWLLKDYIQNANSESGIIEYRFTLHSNTFMDERYKERIIASTPTGMLTDRNIYGEICPLGKRLLNVNRVKIGKLNAIGDRRMLINYQTVQETDGRFND